MNSLQSSLNVYTCKFSQKVRFWKSNLASLFFAEVTCGTPANLQNGHFVDHGMSVYYFGVTIMYYCNPGFKLEKPSTREVMCNENGYWDGTPICEGYYNLLGLIIVSRSC